MYIIKEDLAKLPELEVIERACSIFVQGYGMGEVRNRFQEYYPGTRTVESIYEQRREELREWQEQQETPKQPTATRRKEKLTHKSQMVLADLLGVTNHPLLQGLTPKQKGVILGELMNRSVDDTKNMLNPETSKSDEKLNWNTDFYQGEVRVFLNQNGITITDK